jgi:hypothetical protein
VEIFNLFCWLKLLWHLSGGGLVYYRAMNSCARTFTAAHFAEQIT